MKIQEVLEERLTALKDYFKRFPGNKADIVFDVTFKNLNNRYIKMLEEVMEQVFEDRGKLPDYVVKSQEEYGEFIDSIDEVRKGIREHIRANKLSGVLKKKRTKDPPHITRYKEPVRVPVELEEDSYENEFYNLMHGEDF